MLAICPMLRKVIRTELQGKVDKDAERFLRPMRMAMKTYLVIGSEARDKVPAHGAASSQSTSIAFAEQLFRAATGLTADAQTYEEFRDRLFKGPKRVFDFVDIGEDGKRLGKRTLALLRNGMKKSDRIILLGKSVAERISQDDVPPERRIEIGGHGRDRDDVQTRESDWEYLALDPGIWELIVRLALELAT